MSIRPAFLALPLEIRHIIYSHLCSREPISYPWKRSPISSIDIRPPSSALQLTCRFLCSEIQSYYYGRATLRFVNPAIPLLFSGENCVSCEKAIRLAKKVEIMLIWNVTAQQAQNDYRSWSMHTFLSEIVDFLSEKEESLGLVTLSVKDASDTGVDWSFKRNMLEPLAGLPPKVRLVVGEVTAIDDEEEETLRQNLHDYLERLKVLSLAAISGFDED